MQKKKLLFFSITFLLGVIGVFMACFSCNRQASWSTKIKYEAYLKYSMSIYVDTIEESNKTFDSLLIKVSDDGNNASISSNKQKTKGIIVNKKLYYFKDKDIYIYDNNKSYRDTIKLLTELNSLNKVSEVGEYTNYTTVLSSDQINDILESLYIVKKTSKSAIAKIQVKGKKLVEFNLNLADLKGYEEVRIKIRINELEDDFKVNTSKLYPSGNHVSSSTSKKIKTDENIFQLLGD